MELVEAPTAGSRDEARPPRAASAKLLGRQFGRHDSNC